MTLLDTINHYILETELKVQALTGGLQENRNLDESGIQAVSKMLNLTENHLNNLYVIKLIVKRYGHHS